METPNSFSLRAKLSPSDLNSSFSASSRIILHVRKVRQGLDKNKLSEFCFDQKINHKSLKAREL